MSENQVVYELKDLDDAIAQSGRAYNVALIHQAYQMAATAHEAQYRRSGEHYISHPVGVAVILVSMGMDSESVAAALLHDVVEDTTITLAQLEKTFGKDISQLVSGVTKLGAIAYSSKEEEQAENVRRMLMAMAQDVRVIIIKLADRLHNARTFASLSEEKRRYKARETLEIYAPIAHRLGMKAIKEELEDCSLRYLDPIAFAEIEAQLNSRKDERQRILNNIRDRIRERVVQEHPHAMVEGRVKSLYGIYRKVYIAGRPFDDVYDIYAIRVIVDSVIECYNVLGIVHDMFRPIPNRFKDYISTPKQNMYQSLHTTVFDKEGIPFEIQIRTWEMHQTAEYGIAAHWKYKMGLTSGKDSDGTMEERLAWVRQLIESQQEGDDVEEIIHSIKSEIAPDEVFVFTPKGDVLRLPTGATVLDFAYAIHSAVGNRMIGAKIDGKMVPIDTSVQTGMIVEIIAGSKNQGPSRDWLTIAKTSEARNKIRTWFKKERREENIQEGRQQVEREFKRNSILLADAQLNAFLLDEAKRQHVATVDDLYNTIGYGGLSLSRIMPRLKEEYQKRFHAADEEEILEPLPLVKKEQKATGGVIVEGLEGCLVKFARCCNPLPGDSIVGFATRGSGVSIHKRDCSNFTPDNPDQAGRWMSAEWANTVREVFKTEIEVIASSRGDMLADVSVALGTLRIPLYSFVAKEQKEGRLGIFITLGARDITQLNFVIATLKKVPGVFSIQRVVHT